MEHLLQSLGDSLGSSLGGNGGEEGLGDLGEGEGDLPREVVQVMQVLESQMVGEPVKPEVSVEERVERCREKQTYLESRYRRLQNRINKLRAEKLAAHATEQLQAVVSSCDKRRARLNGEIKAEEEMLKTDKGTEGVGGDAGGEEEKIMRRVTRVKRYPKGRTDEVLGQMQAAIRHVQHLADPEATESSSGGDSADEQEPGPEGALLFAPMEDRAVYQWYSSRAQLASQWVWLQAQVSDLEYKIRQHTELYRAQRASKGPVTLGEEVVSWPLHSKPGTQPGEILNLAIQTPSRVYSRSSSLGDGGGDTSDEESSMTCSRVRPVKRVRRRKVVDTYGLHHRVGKAARLSTVACGCLHPEYWCVLCLGRRSHTAPMDRSVQSRVEGAALLDHSYHAVLSDRVEIPLSLALMESMATRRWLERRPQPLPGGQSGPAHISKLINIQDLEKKEKKQKKDEVALKRKYLKRKEREGKIVKKRRKPDSERGGSRAGSRPETPTDFGLGEVTRDLTLKVRDGVERIRDRNSLTEQLKKKRKSNYDIDHIVIPYSMAATTRVEKLQYKEIQTPSWKEVEICSSSKKDKAVENTKDENEGEKPVQEGEEEEEEEENTSELNYKLMHAKAEEEERVRWATPLGRVHGGQRGHHGVGSRGQGRTRRLDSCRTEASSGTNTPSNPLSPEAIDRVEELMVGTRPGSPVQEGEPVPPSPCITQTPGPLLSPGLAVIPPTPGIPATPATTALPTLPASLRGRRRTSSTTGRDRRDRNLSEASQHSQESSRSTSPWTEVEDTVVTPWEPRVFPLSEDEARQLEDDSALMLPPSLCGVPTQSSATVSAETSRASSRTSSVEERAMDSADPDWDEDADDAKEEAGDDDPEYDPDARQRLKGIK